VRYAQYNYQTTQTDVCTDIGTAQTPAAVFAFFVIEKNSFVQGQFDAIDKQARIV
jgi:hypothetical protein